jgi:tetratricopeptide (TPR) repeat protein
MRKIRYVEILLIIIFLQILFVVKGNAAAFFDPTDYFSLGGEVDDGDYPISGVTLNFYIDGVKITSTVNDAKGLFKINLRHNTIYIIEALKEGYIPEKVELNTTVTNDVLRSGGIGETFDFTISIFKDYPGLKTEAFSEPVVYYNFNSKKGWYFEPDTRKSKMGTLYQIIAKTNQLMQRDYNKLISEGDKLLVKNKTEDAFYKYVQAALLIPDDENAHDKAKKILKAYKKEKLLDDFYQRTIESADDAFQKKDYDKARYYYNYATAIKPKDKQIKNDLQSLAEVTSTIYLQNRSRYDSIKGAADESYKIKDYNKALGYYESALQLFPNDGYAKSKIIATNKIMHQKTSQPLTVPVGTNNTSKNKSSK